VIDPRRDGSDPELVARIRDEIQSAPDRRITFARFMERALTEPGLGYYATSRDRPTRGGDFLTAPELHPFFGRLMGRQLSEIWQAMESPGAFTVREYGAGRGTLERTVRDGLEADRSGLSVALEWQALDVGTPVPAASVTGAIVANEFIDVLPVHRVVMRRGGLRERYVTWQDGWFGECDASPSSARLAKLLAADGVSLAPGQVAELSLAAGDWARGLGAMLERGVALVIDYGQDAAELFGERHRSGTLVSYREHMAGDDPFVFVGHQDLTAHVDLTALDREARAGGLQRVGSTTLAQFMAALGLGELLSTLGRDRRTDPERYLLARAAAARFLDPRHLGGFRVMAWARGALAGPPLHGFAGKAP
jgi:SAM-dependent MidA family methyltransferase